MVSKKSPSAILLVPICHNCLLFNVAFQQLNRGSSDPKISFGIYSAEIEARQEVTKRLMMLTNKAKEEIP